jgi:amidase
MKSRRNSGARLTAAYLARIEEIDKSGPKLNSVIEMNPEAMPSRKPRPRTQAEKSSRPDANPRFG